MPLARGRGNDPGPVGRIVLLFLGGVAVAAIGTVGVVVGMVATYA